MAKTKTTGKKGKGKGNQSVKIGFIGAGGRATSTHYASLMDIPEAEIVGIAELNEDRMNAVADKFGVKGRYANYEEMIEKEKPDAVYAIMPPQHLYDVAAAVMEMGCHLLIEKPPAVTTEQTRQMAILAKKNKVLTGVAFQRRFSPLIQKGKALCEKMGPVHSAVATFYKNAVGAGPYYRGAMDILTCDAIHAVDTLRYLCGGEVTSVASDVRRLDAGYCNIHLALVTFSTGATGVLLTNWMTGRRMFTVEIHSPGISFFGDPEEGGQVYADGKVEPARTLDPFEISGSKDAYRAYGGYDINRHFISCIQKGKEPQTNFSDAVKTMELVDAIYEWQI